MELRYTLYLCAVLIGLPAVLCQSECQDVIGTADQTEYTEATDSMLYLNLDNPAQCNGTVSSYRYCHYDISSSPSNLQFNAILAVFRKEGNTYQPVVGSVVPLTRRSSDTNLNQFNCLNADLLSESMSVQVQPGDVLGACVAIGTSGNNREQLNLAGNVSNESISLSGVPRSVCDPANIPTIDSTTLMDIPGRVLHLSAALVPTTDPPPTDPPPTDPPPTDIPPTTDDGTNPPPGGGATGDSAAGVAVGVVFGLLFAAVLTALIVIVVVVLIKKRGKGSYSTNNTSTEIQKDQYTVPGQEEQQEALYDEIPESPETNVVSVPVESNAAYGITGTVPTEENIPTDINTSYHVTRGPSEEGNEYYSVIPPEGEITETTHTMEMVNNEAYTTAAVHNSENPEYDYAV